MLAAILLAAGGSSRFGHANKLLALWRGRPLIDHSLDRFISMPARRLIVVTGRDRARIERIVRARHDPRLRVVHNPLWRSGLAGSISRGIAATPPLDRLILIALGDVPGGGGSLRPLLRAIRDGAAAARPGLDGELGHPVLLRREALAGLSAKGDRGLWGELASAGARLAVIPSEPATILDIDDRAAFRRLTLRRPELPHCRRV